MNFKKVFRGYDPQQVDKYIADTAAKEQQIRTAQKERIDELSDENYTLRQQVKQYRTDEQAISKSLIASQQLAQELKFDAQRFSDLVLSRAKIFYATWRAYAKTLVAALSEEEVKQFNALRRKIEEVINAYEGKDVAREMDEHAARPLPQTQNAEKAAAPSTGEQAPTSNAAHADEQSAAPEQEQDALQAASAVAEEPHEQVAQAEQPSPEQSAPEEPHEQTEQHEQAEQFRPQERPAAATSNAANGEYRERSTEQTGSAALEHVEPSAAQEEPLSEEERWRRARAVVDVTPSEKTMQIFANPITKVEEASGQVIDLRELTKTDMSLEDLCAELGLIVKKD